MKVLGIDTATKTCCVALIDGNKLMGEFILNNFQTHSERLMPLIDKLLDSLGIKIDEIEGIAVSRGPGAFTGLRIGIGTAQGLAMGNEIPLVGVSTLDALAYQRATLGYICPIMDAKKQELYTSLYYVNEKEIEQVWDYSIMKPKDLIAELNNDLTDRDIITFVGDGFSPYKEELLSDVVASVNYSTGDLELNRGFSIARLGLNKINVGEGCAPEELTPLYLRKSEAERKREEEDNG
ncbi:tRNA (adenosine(37)-N6)-threonylcarbamoyltransferase complex dimerization subunit type 1 TsaB [Natranaerobius thermophilus]|uniref:Peptidase M22 glycoprotease n=1 Tax=Natranaerobius thermophilus (strain ATCC BAA-1301 / DSM 18059 / JW/NM-WN-LF) TaxID=457570 RepID=B2A5P8_NATTJ|nr:tRNA (adenosine(37)-N6)-threonylcarbamoyltransferase complex dimerization subunit type 1 TsaB [Natranaerobius thermophilus]ACB83996.1 peptidase M22 glycoprotease [Natranaerobius thermophilus JW/NM-WN-LF]